MALHTAPSRRGAAALVALAALAAVVGLAGLAVAGGASQAADPELTVLAANESVDDRIATPADVRAMRAAGTLTEAGDDDAVVFGDTMVVQIRSDSLNRSVARAAGANTTERFFSALDGPAHNLTVRAVVGPNRQPYEIALERSGSRVLRDGENATLSVVVDTSELVVTERDSDERYHWFPGQDDFEVAYESRAADARLEDHFEFVGPDATVRTTTTGLRLGGRGPARVDADTPTVVLSGYTNLLPNRTATVQAVGPNGSVLATDTVTTTENDSAAANPERARSDFQALLSGVAVDGDEWYTLRATSANRTLWERRVVVGPEPRWSNLSARVVDRSDDTLTLRVEATIDIPDDGLFEVYFRTEDGYRSRTVPVAPGRSTKTMVFEHVESSPEDRVELEVFWDADGNGKYTVPPDDTYGTTADVPGARRGELEYHVPVEGSDAVESSPTPTPTPTPTATTQSPSPPPSPTSTATTAATGATSTSGPETPTLTVAKPTPTPTGTESGEGATPTDGTATGTTDDGPGFGAGLAVIAVALVTAVAVFARRS